jgi:hypothetical protein
VTTRDGLAIVLAARVAGRSFRSAAGLDPAGMIYSQLVAGTALPEIVGSANRF